MFIQIIWKEKCIGVREVYCGNPEEIISQIIDRAARMTIDLVRDIKEN
jgi:hypothetical protein